MNKETKHPTLFIESPNGTVIRIYQPVPIEYIKELMDDYFVSQNLVKPFVKEG